MLNSVAIACDRVIREIEHGSIRPLEATVRALRKIARVRFRNVENAAAVAAQIEALADALAARHAVSGNVALATAMRKNLEQVERVARAIEPVNFMAASGAKLSENDCG